MTRCVMLGAMLVVACGPTTPNAPTARERERPRPRPRPRTRARAKTIPVPTAGLAKATQKFRIVSKVLAVAVKKGGFPKLAQVLKGQGLSVPKECTGRLRTDLGVLTTPVGKTKLRDGRIRPGAIFALAIQHKRDPSEPAHKPTPIKARNLNLCAVTVAIPGARSPYRLQVVPLASDQEAPKKIEAVWKRLGPGRALLTMALKDQPEDNGPHASNPDNSQTAGIVYVCHEGRYKRLLAIPLELNEMSSHGGISVTSVSFKIVQIGAPPQPRLVRVQREETTSPQETGTPGEFGGMETSWTETYRFFRFAKAFSVVTEVKGKGLAVLLKNQTLAPYRKSKSGGEDSP